jgi:hypothetical protein
MKAYASQRDASAKIAAICGRVYSSGIGDPSRNRLLTSVPLKVKWCSEECAQVRRLAIDPHRWQ